MAPDSRIFIFYFKVGTHISILHESGREYNSNAILLKTDEFVLTQFNIVSEGFHAFLTLDNHIPGGNTIARNFHLFSTLLSFLTLLHYFKYEDTFSAIKNEYKALAIAG